MLKTVAAQALINSKDLFFFQKFVIHQKINQCKVGTDAVLLASILSMKRCKNIVEIGSGTAIIPLILAQKDPESMIITIEIDHKSFDEAKENIKNSIFSSQIEIHNIPMQAFISPQKFDLCISNPPYFNGYPKHRNPQRKISRYQETMNYNDLFNFATYYLHEMGILAFIHPSKDKDYCDNLAEKNQMNLNERIVIKHSLNHQSKRHISIYGKMKQNYLESELMLYDKLGRKTEAYFQLVKDLLLRP